MGPRCTYPALHVILTSVSSGNRPLYGNGDICAFVGVGSGHVSGKKSINQYKYNNIHLAIINSMFYAEFLF